MTHKINDIHAIKNIRVVHERKNMVLFFAKIILAGKLSFLRFQEDENKLINMSSFMS